MEQVAAVLAYVEVDLVLDVGANRGQYARSLRAAGYAGRIVSFEPIGALQAELERAAAMDPAWMVAPPMALGAERGEAWLDVSAESDMSSLLPQTDLLARVSPTSAVIGREPVRVEPLDRVAPPLLEGAERPFLKLDVQGFESQVLDGARDVLERLVGLQLELPLAPCYRGEADWRRQLDRLEAAGFTLWLVLPGYFERKLARQLQFDAVLMRAEAAGPRSL
jgi:FkbM family methyltransferase